MKLPIKLAFAAFLALSAGLLPRTTVAADAYPTKMIKLVVAFPAGGPTDIVGRLIGQQLAKDLGQTVIIENNGGAGGIIGAGNVARAKPDGYTLLMAVEASNTRALALNPSVAYNQEKSFTYIRKVAKQRTLIVVNPKVPANTLGELIAYLKAHPGELNFGGTFGATSHIGGTLFDAGNGTKMTFINYSGGAQPITDTLSNVVQVGFFSEATVAQHVKEGTLRALAVAANERSPAFPDLPTVKEAGGAELDISPWFGVAGPPNLPDDVVEKIGGALDRIADNKDFLAQLETLGAMPIHGSTQASMTADVTKEIAFWNKWAKDIGGPLR